MKRVDSFKHRSLKVLNKSDINIGECQETLIGKEVKIAYRNLKAEQEDEAKKRTTEK
jgi:hypothetical protein